MKKRDYRVICDRTGQKIWASQAKMEWNGLYVKKSVWDPKSEYLLIPNVMENLNVPIARPEGTDVFIDTTPQDYFLFQDGERFLFQDGQQFEYN